MAHHPMWQPDFSSDPSDLIAADEPHAALSRSDASGVDNPRLKGDEFDFAELAAQFAAHGGGIPKDLSAELALDVVLNEIVEQACLATGATGAAIAFARGAEMVCRASSGVTAPDLGTRLDMNSGLSGTCARTRQTQCCDDAFTDPRVDADVSRELGVRSVAVLPILHEEELLGIFEIFSPRPCAFGDRDLRTLEVLARRILRTRQSSLVSGELAPAAPVPSPPVPSSLVPAAPPVSAPPARLEPAPVKPVVETPQAIASEELVKLAKAADFESMAGASSEYDAPGAPDHGIEVPLPPEQRFDWLMAVMGTILVLVAILMGAVSGVRLRSMQAGGHVSSATAAPTVSSEEPPPSSGTAKATNEASNAQVAAPTKKGTGSRPDAIQIIQLSPDMAEDSLVHRVEPQYPAQALVQHIQGPVLLDVFMNREGAVQNIVVMSGDPVLAEAAIAAVRQWRFKPQTLNSRTVESETRVTLRFVLPAR